MQLPVEVFAYGQRHLVALADLSSTGMFLDVSAPLPVGTEVRVAIAVDGRRQVTGARVIHTRSASEATLGRGAGMGVAFREPRLPIDEKFATAIDRLLITHRAVLWGSLVAVSLPTVLTMLEQERKTGRLTVTGEYVAWIDVVDGHVVAAGTPTTIEPPLALVMAVLDWTTGTFELSTRQPISSELAMPITHLLLEHARMHDEASRPHRRPTASA